ncbi:TPA_asm: DUF3310 domain-containing protein [Listeria monocytogenes]|nr:DUF3310 domain-containing protein [Listeria monocytogenes]EAG5724552.1 DUF3310 domain-containing protein [Listeria monocytogenes]EAK9290190.1 DUF3310 domain-containing protein [Listeria monocytogenes]HAA0113794.1 DUF3310 domain-containing protein [Listeria monocytogenes]HAA0224820.1 DUF3310 domain-containing protein [Listeria monocytogenes]
MFKFLRKFPYKWKYNQEIYVERMDIEEIILPNKENKQMKLYHVETQEDYDALMVELEKEGCRWASETKPTNENNWIDFKRDTVIERSAQNRLTYAHKYYFENPCTTTPIEKYKAKTYEVEKWAKHVEGIKKRWFAEGVPINKVNNDNVNNPSHYTSGGIETIDYIKAKVKDYPSYAAGNILKYVSRYEHKNGIEDLKKAQFYLNDLIKWMESD